MLLNLNMLIPNSISGRVLRALSVIRLRAFDTSTIEGRSNERFRRVFWTASTSVIAKSVNTLTMLAVVPITLSYLGNERFGLWMAITSLVVFLGFADLGIGNVILNLVSEAYAKNDIEAAKKHVSNAFFMLIWVSVGLGFLFAFMYPQIAWDRFFNVSSSIARREAGPAVAMFVACFIVNLPFSIIPRIQMGYQEGYLTSIWQAISNLIGLGGIIAVVHLKAGLPWLVLVIAGFPIVGNLLNGIGLFAFQRPWLIPRRQDVNALISKKILWVGFLFLILQISNAIIYFSDNIIIAKVLGPEAVTDYAVPYRLFTIVPMILSMFLTPLWPAYAEANSRGDGRWMKKTLINSILTTFAICALSSFFLIAFGEKILEIWVGSKVIFSLSLMVSLGIWNILSSVLTAIALFLNAINKIRFQVIFALPTAIFSILAKVVLAGSVGLPGVAYGNVAVSVLIMLLPYAIYLAMWFAKQPNTLVSSNKEVGCYPT
jgi:O-antigen/teichoic acid export membrane protein